MAEKALHEIPRSWRDLYQKGLAALQRNNLDYAITIFSNVLENEPGFYDCREALRASQHKRAGGKGGFFKKVFGSASNSSALAKGQIVLRSNPAEAIKIAENILNADPNNVSAHKLLADAALAMDLPKTAVLSLEIAFKNQPKDREIAIQLAESLPLVGEVAKAEAIYSDLQRAYPNDPSIHQGLKNISARRTLKEGGYDALAGGEGSYRDILKDREGAIALEQEQREHKTEDVLQNLINEQTARLKNEPGNLKVRRTLAELYAQKNEFDRALEIYSEMMQGDGAQDPALEREITQTTLRKFDYTIAQLDLSQPDQAKALETLKTERQNYALSQGQRQVERYPNDLQLRFDLGVLYYEAGRISEAIQEFQRAQSNPHRKIAALLYLGHCFARRGMNDLAARTYEKAIAEKLILDDEKKELIYSLGCVLEKMGKPDLAVEQFKIIYEADIGYRDVAAKVDAYYAAHSGSTNS